MLIQTCQQKEGGGWQRAGTTELPEQGNKSEGGTGSKEHAEEEEHLLFISADSTGQRQGS